MTTPQDNKLTPGRDLDSLVAEKVMGLETYKEVVPFCPQCEFKFNPKSPGRVWCHQCSEWVYSSTKEYSTDISAAISVAETFHHWSLEKDENGKEYEAILFQKNLFEGVFYNYYGRADTAPHAICLAALKAVGHE